MRLLGGAVCLSLIINMLVIWQLHLAEERANKLFSNYVGSVGRELEKPAISNQYVPAISAEALSTILGRLEKLDSRLEMLENNDDELAVEQSTVGQYSEPEAGRKMLANAFSSTSESEEWFWEGEDQGEEKTLSFSSADDFVVNSMVCRSEWCRVEVDTGDNQDGDLVSELELHLSISESLGRDTTIVSGEINGNVRTLFIK